MDFSDREAVRACLIRHGQIASTDLLAATLLDGGVSCNVIRVETPERVLVLKQALPKLKVKEDWWADTGRNVIERQVMTALHATEPEFVPKILFVDEGDALFAMDYIPGRSWKAELLASRIDQRIGVELGQFLGRVHGMDVESWNSVRDLGSKTLFYQLRISPYFEVLKARHPEYGMALEAVIATMMGTSMVLAHGDFSPKNILLRPVGQTVQPVVVDWEVSHIGHPSFDVGFMMHHLLLKAIHAGDPKPYLALARSFYDAYFESSAPSDNQFQDMTLRTTGALMMARVDGKSPVEYLTLKERAIAWRIGKTLLTAEAQTWEMVGDCICEEVLQHED